MAITWMRQDYDPITHTEGEPWTEVAHVGRVLRVFNRVYRAMSDVYTNATWAEVWDDAQARPVEVLVNANFECDGSGGRAQVDADARTLAAKLDWDVAQEELRRVAEHADRLRREAQVRNTPTVGKRMRVTGGRRVPIGHEGVVAYVRDGRALLKDPGCWQDRNADGVWVAARFLEAV